MVVKKEKNGWQSQKRSTYALGGNGSSKLMYADTMGGGGRLLTVGGFLCCLRASTAMQGFLATRMDGFFFSLEQPAVSWGRESGSIHLCAVSIKGYLPCHWCCWLFLSACLCGSDQDIPGVLSP